MKRYDATADKVILQNKRGWLHPKTTTREIHVYADNEDDAKLIMQVQGYKNIKMKGQDNANIEIKERGTND